MPPEKVYVVVGFDRDRMTIGIVPEAAYLRDDYTPAQLFSAPAWDKFYRIGMRVARNGKPL